MDEYKDIDLEAIKLVIWDLDETFWEGVLSDNNSIVKPVLKNIKLVKTLTDKGIVNSICSKNDHKIAEDELAKSTYENIKENFVFSSINWEPKGERIKNIIKNMGLRNTNVLFIDDNISNLNEAKFSCPDIKTALPNIIDKLIDMTENLKKSDSEHKRLKQYKVLEEKTRQKEKFSSNELFLKQSEIKAQILDDCNKHFDRILELIRRTNQLNYTKIRLNGDELKNLLNDSDYENRYITVSDKYGDYGICGFYSLCKGKNKLVHFLFSCRTLGMGIEQYVYDFLNYPDFDMGEGEVAVKLEKNKKCTWVNQSNIKNTKAIQKEQNTCKILVKGTCDICRTVGYLKSNFSNIKSEIANIDNERKSTMNAHRAINIVNSREYSKETKDEIMKDCQFITKEMYNQSIFTEKYDVIIYSLLLDTRTSVYLHKKTGCLIGYWDFAPFTDKSKHDFYLTTHIFDNYAFTKELLDDISEKFEYKGLLTPEQVIKYLDYMIKNVDPKTKWIFTLGSEVRPSDEQLKEYAFRFKYERYCLFNKKIIKFLKKKGNVTFIEYKDVIKSNQEYTDNTDHLTLECYKRLANEMIKKINILTGKYHYKLFAAKINSILRIFLHLKYYFEI